MSSVDRTAAVTVIVRARLRGDLATARQLHDQVTGATREQGMAAGDLSHRTFVSAAEPDEFLGIDEWRSADAFQAFAANPQIAEFFGQLFDGQPDVTVWLSSRGSRSTRSRRTGSRSPPSRRWPRLAPSTRRRSAEAAAAGQASDGPEDQRGPGG
jgi:quinol monooxygenase YgiN